MARYTIRPVEANPETGYRPEYQADDFPHAQIQAFSLERAYGVAIEVIDNETGQAVFDMQPVTLEEE